tara:strand:- start:573 stop:998 length:426 start_codon:yes stop_codon:yes gene_type:complete
MTENYKILAEFIKDISSETPDVESYLFVKENIKKYKLNISISSKPLKNKIIEINTILKFSDPEQNQKKAYFEIVYTIIVRIIEDKITDKKDLEKIVLCDVPNKIYPNLEKIFLNLLNNSGYPNIKIEKKIDFYELYKSKTN